MLYPDAVSGATIADGEDGGDDTASAAMNARLLEAAEMEALGDDDEDEDEDDGVDMFALPADFDDGLNLDDDPEDIADMDDDVDVVSDDVLGRGGGADVSEAAALAALSALFGDDNVEDEAAVRRKARAAERANTPTAVTCARCYSLRNYGRVKNEAAEILMPSFDFGRVVGDRLRTVGPGA